MARGTIPQGFPPPQVRTSACENMPNSAKGKTALLCTRWSLTSPSNSRMQTSGTATETRPPFCAHGFDEGLWRKVAFQIKRVG